MGWEIRNGRPHFYLKIRRGRKVISKYVGNGLAGHLEAQAVEARKYQRSRLHGERKALREPTAIELEIDDAIALVNAVVTGFLLVEGYHQHKRGDWRKPRTNA